MMFDLFIFILFFSTAVLTNEAMVDTLRKKPVNWLLVTVAGTIFAASTIAVIIMHFIALGLYR